MREMQDRLNSAKSKSRKQSPEGDDLDWDGTDEELNEKSRVWLERAIKQLWRKNQILLEI